MQTEEWMKRKKEELRVTKAHAVFKEQVTENTKPNEQKHKTWFNLDWVSGGRGV